MDMKGIVSIIQKQGRLNAVGYAVSFLCIVAMAGFQCTGYLERPAIFDPDQYAKILQSDIVLTHPAEFYAYGKVDGKNMLQVKTNGHHSTGFLVPIHACTIPNETRQLGVIFKLIYQGIPVIHYGFTTVDPKTGVPKTMKSIRVDLRPSPDQTITLLIPPRIFKEDQYPISWKQADYFYISVYSDTPAEVAFDDIQFIGY